MACKKQGRQTQKAKEVEHASPPRTPSHPYFTPSGIPDWSFCSVRDILHIYRYIYKFGCVLEMTETTWNTCENRHHNNCVFGIHARIFEDMCADEHVCQPQNLF